MPGIDGMEATRRIREHSEHNRQTRIAALTASATTEDRAQCLAAGMSDYLTKPLTIARLQQFLEVDIQGVTPQ